MKRNIAVISLFCALVMGAGSCSFLPFSSAQSNQNDSGVEEIVFTDIYKGVGAFSLSQNQTKTLDINQDITGKEYIKITLNSNVNLLGEYKYSDIANPGKVVTEPFYIEPSTEIRINLVV